MVCLLIAATGFEISPFIKSFRNNNEPWPDDPSVDVLITGIGLMSAAYAITKQLQIRKPGIIIQAGIAGCFDKKLPLGTVVAVRQDRVADLGVIEDNKLKTIFDLGFAKPGQFPFSKGWLVNKSSLPDQCGLPEVNGISVNEVTTSRQKIKLYKEQFQPVTESLEGAALHYTALMENIPFLQIRAISNYIGERDKAKWDIKKSVANLNSELIKILKTLNS